MDNIGSIFEAGLKEAFSLLKTSHCLGNVRFTDSKEAGSIVRATPSDFLLVLPPESKPEQRVIFFEAKASQVKTSLKKAMLQPSQKRAVQEYSNLLKIPYIICFWDAKNGVIEFWNGAAALGNGKVKDSFLLLRVENAGVSKLAIDVFCDAFVKLFSLPQKSYTLWNYNDYSL